MTLAEFRVAYPEWDPIEDDTVQAKLDAAELRVSSDAFGTNYDQAQGLLAAHLLWTSPHGAPLRLESGGDENKSRYLAEFAALRTEVVPSFLVT